MARELSEVLHHFLGDSFDHERLGPATLALVSAPDDAFAVGVTWNLAHELARAGLSVAWVTSLPDEELLPPDATPGLARLLAPAPDAAALARAAAEAAAKLAAARTPGLVLLRVPPAWLERAGALLAWTLQLSGPDDDACLATTEIAGRIRGLRPDARIGITMRDVRNVAAAERAFGELARRQAEGGPGFLSYGTLLDDAEIYRSLLSRRPLALLRPDGRATRSVADVARLLRADFPPDGD